MNLTIKTPLFATIACQESDGLYDLSSIARELRLDFPKSRPTKPSDWLEANNSGMKNTNQVQINEKRIYGTLMAVYVYIDWLNAQTDCITDLLQVFPDSDILTTKRSVSESLEIVEATLDSALETVNWATMDSFESDKPRYDVKEHLHVYDYSIHLKAMLRHMLAVLHDSCSTAQEFDRFYGAG